MQIDKILGKIEAILFVSGEAVETAKIAKVLNLNKHEMDYCISLLDKKYNTEFSGIRFLELSQDLQLASNSVYIETIREVMDLKRNAPLSSAAMEVLALVAYNQPVTKAFLEQIRGVDCSGVVSSLAQKGLVQECGRLELPGRPLLYETTNNFLRCFGISSLSQLPEILQDKDDDENQEEEDD